MESYGSHNIYQLLFKHFINTKEKTYRAGELWDTLEDRRTKTKLITFQTIRLNNLEVFMNIEHLLSSPYTIKSHQNFD